MPEVTIIIPAYNNFIEFLPETLASVADQTYQDYTISVVDSDNGLGLAEARNLGVKHCETPWVLFLDADDKLRPNFLFSAMAVAGEDVDIVIPNSAPLTSSIYDNNYISSCALVRKSYWEKLGGQHYPSKHGQGMEDWDWWIRVWLDRHGKNVANISPLLVWYRHRADSMSRWPSEQWHLMATDIWEKYAKDFS